MRTGALRGVAVGVCLLGMMEAAHAAQSIRWAKSFNSALAQAKKSNALVMADFYTDW